MAEKHVKPCGHTVEAGVSAAVAQLSVWRQTAARQAEATRRAAAAAEVVLMIWDKLTPEEQARIEGDSAIRERIRTVTGFYGFTCS